MSANGNKTMSKIISAEQHNATRRAVKAHQKATRRKGNRNGRPIETLIDGIRADRKAQQLERATARQKQEETRKAAQLEFRQTQANLAMERLDDSLYGLGLRVAKLTIEAFPGIDSGEFSGGRLQAAKQNTIAQLTPEEAERTQAIEHGFRRARAALNQAYSSLTA